MTRRTWESLAARATVMRLAGAAAMFLLFVPPPPAAADEVRLLPTPLEAAEERVRLVLEARSEVNAEYFIVGRDPFSLIGYLGAKRYQIVRAV